MRKIIQLLESVGIGNYEGIKQLWALCDDGTLWTLKPQGWISCDYFIPPIPQDKIKFYADRK